MFDIKKHSDFFCIFLICLLFGSALSFAGASNKRFDFKKPEPAKTTVVADSSEVKTTSNYFFIGSDAMWEWLVSSQKNLREKISQHVTHLKNGELASLGIFLFICLIYGLIHALGPGHGKTIVASYFIARRGKILQGVGLGTAITTIHTLSAVALLFALYGATKAALFPLFEASRIHIEKASYALIMLTGLILTIIAIRETVHSHQNETVQATASWKELLWFAFITGIVPCPAVALIVFFCLLNDLPGIALLGAAAICIGMSMTNTVFGIGAILARRGFDKGVRHMSKLHKYAGTINTLISLLCGTGITLFGIFLFLNAR